MTETFRKVKLQLKKISKLEKTYVVVHLKKIPEIVRIITEF